MDSAKSSAYDSDRLKGKKLLIFDMDGTLFDTSESNYWAYHDAANEYNMIHQRQAEGIAAAKARGVKMGRPEKPLPNNFDAVYAEWKASEITAVDAAKKCNMPVSTFKYRAKRYKESTED